MTVNLFELADRRGWKHTPGPWHQHRGAIRNMAGDWLGSTPHTLGDVTDWHNGQLMAAAPELAVHVARLAWCLTDALGQGTQRGAWPAAIEEARALLERVLAEYVPPTPGMWYEPDGDVTMEATE